MIIYNFLTSLRLALPQIGWGLGGIVHVWMWAVAYTGSGQRGPGPSPKCAKREKNSKVENVVFELS